MRRCGGPAARGGWRRWSSLIGVSWRAVRRGGSGSGGGGGSGDDGGKRRSHVPVIHFDTTRLAVERRTLRGAVATFARLRCSTPVAAVHTYIYTHTF